MKTLLIDDEPACCELLQQQIETHLPDLTGLQHCYRGAEASEMIARYEPDLLFLDISLDDRTGINVLDGLTQPPPAVIFITGFADYAIEALRRSAVDYLLKPVQTEELINAVGRVKSRVKQHPGLSALLGALQPPRKSERINVSTQSGFEVLKLEDILYCESDGNYTVFHLRQQRRIMASRTLKDFAQMLESRGFYRIHRSHLINLDHVVRYQRGKSGEVELEGAIVLTVARNKREAFTNHLFLNPLG